MSHWSKTCFCQKRARNHTNALIAWLLGTTCRRACFSIGISSIQPTGKRFLILKERRDIWRRQKTKSAQHLQLSNLVCLPFYRTKLNFSDGKLKY